jgi:very-short-patch-repair endonuclease
MPARQRNAGFVCHKYKLIIYDQSIHGYSEHHSKLKEITEFLKTRGNGNFTIIRDGNQYIVTLDDEKTLTLLALVYTPPKVKEYPRSLF